MKRKIQQSVVVLLLCLFPFAALAEEIIYYHTDNFGTPMAMTDEHGTVVWRSDELPFGEEYSGGTEEIQEQNDRRFLGKEKDDETGLVYMGARYLDPSTGRFNRPDPVGLVDPESGKVNQEMLLDPQRQNRYVYGLNNPYKFVDPDGNAAKDIKHISDPCWGMTEAGGIRGTGGAYGKGFRFRDFFKNTKTTASKNAGRTGKQAKLRELGDDPKVSSADRGWIKNELRHIRNKNRKTIRLPGNSRKSKQGGKVLAHDRGKRAKEGYSYKHSKLQDTDLHKLEHKHEGY